MNGHKVLVVDDNAANRLLAEAILGHAGYTVELAESGRAALAAFEAGPPSLVLLDVLMPGMDGFETLGRLRALPGGAATPVVIVTALTDLASVQRAIACGADDFISKPINRTELLIRVWSLISMRSQRAAAAAAAGAPASGRLGVQPEVPGGGPGQGRPGSDGLAAAGAAEGAPASKRHEVMDLIIHDLKHPLATIYFNAGLLRRDVSLSPRALEKVARILRSSEVLEAMIMNVLDVARSAEVGLRLSRSEFDLGLLLAEVAANMQPQAEASQQKIEHAAGQDVARVDADRDLVRRILENLVDNSTKYAPPATTIRLEARAGPEGVELRVRDQGPGIPPEKRSNVFEKYVQLERDAAAHGRRGRGLGLVFVRLAAEAHGGSVTIEDHPGGGGCFCVLLPRAVQPADRQAG